MSWTSAKSSETSRKWVSFSGCLCWFQGQLCRIALSVSEMSLKSHEYIRSHTNNLTFSYCIGQGSPKKRNYLHIYVLLVQSLSHVRLFATPWTAARQASLSISNSQSSLRLRSIKSVMPSSHLILCRPLLLPPSIFPSFFPMSQFFASGGQSIGASASAPVLPVNTQGWVPLGWTGGISVQPKGLSRVFCNTTSKASVLHCSVFLMVQLSHQYMTSGKTILWLYGLSIYIWPDAKTC